MNKITKFSFNEASQQSFHTLETHQNQRILKPVRQKISTLTPDPQNWNQIHKIHNNYLKLKIKSF